MQQSNPQLDAMNIPTRGATLTSVALDLYKKIDNASGDGSQSVLTNERADLMAFANHVVHFNVPKTVALSKADMAAENPQDRVIRMSTDAINKYLKDGVITGQPTQIRAAFQPLTRFRLLLQLGSTLGFETRDATAGERMPFTRTIPTRLIEILEDLTPWYSPAKKLSSVIATAMVVDDDTSIWKKGSGSLSSIPLDAPQEAFATNITNLVNSTLNIKLSTLYRVKGNLQILAYMVKWHMTHDFPFPHTPELFAEQIITEGDRLNLPPLAKQAVAMLKSNIKDTYNTMCWSFDVAVTISPLVLLSAVASRRLETGRPAMLEYGRSLGPKPDDIKAAEHALWKLCLAVASGEEIMPLLEAYLREHSGPPTAEPDYDSKSWFILGDMVEEAIGEEDGGPDSTNAPRASIEGSFHPSRSASPQQENAPSMAPSRAPSRAPSVDGDRGTPSPVPVPVPVDKGKKRARDLTPPQERRSGRVKVTRKPQDIDNAGQVPAQKRLKTTRPKRREKADKSDPLGSRMQLVLEVYQKFQIKQEHAKNQDQNKTTLTEEDLNPPMDDEAVDVELWDGWKDHPATTFQFRANKGNAPVDTPLLKKIVQNSTRHYVDGQPRHRRESARDVQFDPQDKDGSCVFICSLEEFKEMSVETKHDIFGRRHILVLDTNSNERWKFDEKSLARMGALDDMRQIQCAHFKTDKNGASLLRKGTLRQVIDVANNKFSAVLNVLDLPMGDSNRVGVPPCYDDMATEEYVTSKLPRQVYAVWDDKDKEIIHSYRDDRLWSTISHLGANSWGHIDDEGFGTCTCTLIGGKIWAIMTRTDDITMESIRAFEDWEITDFPDDKVRFELLYLPPKCVLYMRPCTPHYVMSTDHTVVEGRHFYCSESIVESCCGMVHTFMLGHNVTNTRHDDTKVLAYRLLLLWFRHYCVEELKETDHLVDMSKPKDIRKILALGMILDFSGVLYRPRYEAKKKFVEEIPQERMCFRVLMKTFAARYATRIGDEWVHPSFLYKLSVVAFASALIQYRIVIDNVKDTVNLEDLTKAVEEHFEKDHPDLLPALKVAREQGEEGWLAWNGPPITIERRDIAERVMAAAGLRERRQYSLCPIYF